MAIQITNSLVKTFLAIEYYKMIGFQELKIYKYRLMFIFHPAGLQIYHPKLLEIQQMIN